MKPLSDACKSIWNNIQHDCNIERHEDSFIIPITAIDDAIFDISSVSHRTVDEVFSKLCMIIRCYCLINRTIQKSWLG